jgi:hypothetical protein
MTRDPRLPEELRPLDRLLRSVRFGPRASLGAELMGRARGGEQPAVQSRHAGFPNLGPLTALASLGALLVIALLIPERRVTIDKCCYDLDGGGAADDGTLILAQRDGHIYRLSVYEDRDGSKSLTSTDIMRYDRRGAPPPEQLLDAGRTRIQLCCHDLDGGGPADDGILVLATPPDHVHTAAIYQFR